MDFNKVLRNIIIGGTFLVPFIPFIVSNSMFFPFITGKNFTFRILVEILFGIWVILALRDARYRPNFSWLLVSIAAFVGVIFIADITGANPTKSIWSNYERMEGFVTLLHLFAYFLVAGSALKGEKIWNWFFNTTVGASVVMGIYGVYQLLGFAVINQGGVRVDGTFGNATYLAVYMLIHAFITAILLAKWRGNMFVRFYYIAAIALQLTILFFTATRGAILGFLGGALLTAILIVLFEKERKTLRKAGVGLLAAVVVIVGGFFAVKDTEYVQTHPVLQRFATISPTSGTVQARFTIWGMAWEGVQERPLLGYGQGNFNLVFNQYYEPKLYADEPWFDRTHNIVFDWLIAGGFLGAIAYLLIPLVLIYYIWSRRGEQFSSTEKALLTGLIAGYGFHNLFVFDNMFSYVMYFTILAYVYQMTRHEPKENSITHKELDTGFVDRVAVPMILLATIFSIYFFNAKGILANQTLIDALRQGPSSAQLESFREALAYDSKIGNQEIHEQLVQAAVRAAQNPNLDIQVRQEYFTTASSRMEEHIEAHPGDARLELFLGSLYDAYGQYQTGEEHLRTALSLSPEKQGIRFALMSSLINQQKYQEAFELAEETANLAPGFQQAQIMYAVAAIYTEQNELAEEILAEINENTRANSGPLLLAYSNTGQFDKVLEHWQKRVELNPNNARNYISLAAAHLQLEQREEAIAAIEQAIEKDPNFEAQGNYFIQEIRAGRNP